MVVWQGNKKPPVLPVVSEVGFAFITTRPYNARRGGAFLFSGVSYTFLMLFLGLKREEKEKKSEEKEIPPQNFIIPRRIRFLLLKCDFNNNRTAK